MSESVGTVEEFSSGAQYELCIRSWHCFFFFNEKWSEYKDEQTSLYVSLTSDIKNTLLLSNSKLWFYECFNVNFGFHFP